MPGKLYAESEIGQIMRRAAELQEEGSSEGYVPGVSSEELYRIAKEAGIDPRFLEKAIAEGASKVETKKAKGGLSEIERVYPVEIAPENFDVITEYVKTLPLTTHPKSGAVSGGMSQIGRTLQGQVSAGWANPYIKVTSREGRTKLNVTADNSTAIAMSILWIVPLMLCPVIGAALLPIAGAIMALLVVSLSVLTYRGVSKKANAATVDTADKLERAILENGTSLRENLQKASEPQVTTESHQETTLG
ncbi:MAG: hypothetical protein ABL962_02360 [Fimbriimonadaceae bacterium]